MSTSCARRPNHLISVLGENKRLLKSLGKGDDTPMGWKSTHSGTFGKKEIGGSSRTASWTQDRWPPEPKKTSNYMGGRSITISISVFGAPIAEKVFWVCI